MRAVLFDKVVPLAVSDKMDQFVDYVMTIPAHPYITEYAIPFLESRQLITSKVILSHLHTVLYIAAGYHALFLISQSVLFPPLARYRVSWDTAADADSEQKKSADRKCEDLVTQSAVHLVSWIQSLVVLYLSFEAIASNAESKSVSSWDRVFKMDPYNVKVCVFAIGYFLWDIYISLVYSTFPFVLHGLISTIVYAIGLKPYINYYAGIFLMFELSNPFLNIRWFGIKYFPQLTKECQTFTAKVSNFVQLINNVILILVFFLARICWGFYQFFQLCVDFYAIKDDPNFLPLETTVIVVGNLCLDVLNLFWLLTMLRVAVRIIKKDGKVQDK